MRITELGRPMFFYILSIFQNSCEEIELVGKEMISMGKPSLFGLKSTRYGIVVINNIHKIKGVY